MYSTTTNNHKWKSSLYITQIRSHTGLPGSLVQGNDQTDHLLVENVLEDSDFLRNTILIAGV